MTYVVAGISGNTGSAAAKALLEAGKSVRAIVRDVAKARASAERSGIAAPAEKLQFVQADVNDVESLTRALEGADGAYLLLPPVMNSERTLAVQAETAESLARAVERANIPHVVFLSSVGAHLPSGTGPIASTTYAEKRFGKVANTAFTFLRAAYFMENYATSLGALAQGAFQTFIDPTRVFPQVATVDIGRTAAQALVEGTPRTQVIELSGPEDFSVTDAARIFGEVLGKPLALQVAPTAAMPDVLTSFGLSRDIATLYAEMTDLLNSGKLVYEGGHRRVRGTTPLSTVARKLLHA